MQLGKWNSLKESLINTFMLIRQDYLCPVDYGLIRNLGARNFVQLRVNAHQHQPPQTVDLHPFFCTQQGVIQEIPNVYSPQLNNSRPVFIYLPPSMVENPLPRTNANLLVLLDGQVLPWFNQTIGVLAVSGAIEETVVVGVPSLPDTRTYELTFSVCKPCANCPGGDPSACNCSNNGGSGGGGTVTIQYI